MKKFLVLDGNQVAYKEQGQGQAVVLLHGFCGSSSYWESILPLLPGTFRVIIPDLRGHGDSKAPEGIYSMETLADDIAHLLRQLEIEKAFLLGHSLGGYITLAFAELHSELLAGFGLIHSTAFPDDEKGKEGRLSSMKTIEEKGLRVFIDGLVPKLFAPKHVETMPEAVDEAKRIGYGTNSNAAINTLDGMRKRPDRNHVLSDAKIPVLIVAGENDQIITRERAFSVQGDHITQHLITEVGHMSMMEAPEKLAEAIRTFLAK